MASEAKPPSDPIAEMLALVGSVKLAMQQPASGGAAAAEAGARTLARAKEKLRAAHESQEPPPTRQPALPQRT